jgi:hypothetical protein
MGDRITDLDSAEFARLFTSFEHTAYRLERLQQYGVSYEDKSFRAFLADAPLTADHARDEWTAMVRRTVTAGKTLQRVHVVTEPLTDYMRYELEWWYGPNVKAGEDIRILPAPLPEGGLLLPDHDYWLFDSHHLWVMAYTPDGQFLHAERIDDPAQVVTHAYWRDAALHNAVPYTDYVRRMNLSAAS